VHNYTCKLSKVDVLPVLSDDQQQRRRRNHHDDWTGKHMRYKRCL
jgi:hypothetical protein